MQGQGRAGHEKGPGSEVIWSTAKHKPAYVRVIFRWQIPEVLKNNESPNVEVVDSLFLMKGVYH